MWTNGLELYRAHQCVFFIYALGMFILWHLFISHSSSMIATFFGKTLSLLGVFGTTGILWMQNLKPVLGVSPWTKDLSGFKDNQAWFNKAWKLFILGHLFSKKPEVHTWLFLPLIYAYSYPVRHVRLLENGWLKVSKKVLIGTWAMVCCTPPTKFRLYTLQCTGLFCFMSF